MKILLIFVTSSLSYSLNVKKKNIEKNFNSNGYHILFNSLNLPINRASAQFDWLRWIHLNFSSNDQNVNFAHTIWLLIRNEKSR